MHCYCRNIASFSAFWSGPFFIIKSLQLEAMLRASQYISGRVLDIGCGLQPYRKYVNSVSYVGIDSITDVHPDVCAFSNTLPFKRNSFDAVICTEVLEHLKSPSACLAEAARILAPGGHIYVSVPMCWGIHYEPHDYWRFTGFGISALLEQSGFKVIRVMRYGGIFSMTGQRIIDVFWTKCSCICEFAGRRNAERVASLLVAPWSLFFYLLGKVYDRIDQRDALGWIAVGIKS